MKLTGINNAPVDEAIFHGSIHRTNFLASIKSLVLTTTR
jgi:hypothetical protein